MKKQERANVVLGNLNKFYPKIPIPLKHQNIYELLIAVLLSAQCTDERVNRITPLLFKIANNPYDMSKIPVIKIYKIIKPCGLAPKKSKAISKLIGGHGGVRQDETKGFETGPYRWIKGFSPMSYWANLSVWHSR